MDKTEKAPVILSTCVKHRRAVSFKGSEALSKLVPEWVTSEEQSGKEAQRDQSSSK